MKIALLITGSLRNIEDTYSSIKYHLLDKHDIDTFFYGVENCYGVDKNYQQLEELFSPKKCIVNTKLFYDSIKKTTRSSSYSFYNVMMCNEIKNQYKEENNVNYDIVIRIRLDYFWFRGITDLEFELAKSNILTPIDWSFKSVNSFALSDIFCITNDVFIEKYSSVYNHIEEYQKYFTYHTESIMGFHIKELPCIEIDKHFVFEYPIVERNGLDGDNNKLPNTYYFPKVWNGMEDFNTTSVNQLSALRIRLD
jgi:hypothetical protein